MKIILFPLLFSLPFSVMNQWTDISSSRLDIKFTDQNTGCMVGAGGLIQRTTDGGVSWINQNSPVESQNIHELFVFDNGTHLRIVSNNTSRYSRQGNIYSSSDVHFDLRMLLSSTIYKPEFDM